MGREITLIAMEGLEHPGFCGLVGRLSNKFKKKGHDSAFGFASEGGEFCNYFRSPTPENSKVLVDFAKGMIAEPESGEFWPENLSFRLRSLIEKVEGGEKPSSADLILLSFLERRAHLRSMAKSGVFSGSMVVVKGYELSVFASGLVCGISFEELLQIRNLALAGSYVFPDITIIFSVPVSFSRFYLGQRGLNYSEEFLDDFGLAYEKAIARLQGSSNYGFVVRVKGDKSEGVVFADILNKLSRYIPAFR